jgi:hypothetical protein
LSGTLTSLDDSTPENMSKLMALGHKTLHDPVLECNFITGKLVAIPEAGSNRNACHRYHIAFVSFESPNGYFQNLGSAIFTSLSKCFSGNMQNSTQLGLEKKVKYGRVSTLPA